MGKIILVQVEFRTFGWKCLVESFKWSSENKAWPEAFAQTQLNFKRAIKPRLKLRITLKPPLTQGGRSGVSFINIEERYISEEK